ncbi:MAG: right-handed parallel beta-helix repeat-containing protein [Candidatus Latescibacteria bacterium]|jgi:parallel beta-helix repeat protein|nr:right-handed parallel beta-helix repeat-containing protein [Candidatus Latescibacterota bacterium]
MTIDVRDNRPMTDRQDMVLTVGQGEGMLQGADDKVLQAAADYLDRLGGGVLHILPGTYTMRNALYLHPNLTIRGSGEATVLKKGAGFKTQLIRDSDWYEARVQVEDASGFSVGDGVMLRSQKEGGRLEVVKDTVTTIEGDIVSLSRRMMKNKWLDEDATIATVHPILTADERVDDVTIEDLVLDGNKDENEEINGNYSGATFLQHCHRYAFRNVTARNYNGDGFSFQICDDFVFESCQSIDNANLGLHPGSGSQRPVFRDCVARGNSQGIFFCWGVSDGLAENCTCSGNRDFGISIGHRDTDNRIVNCTIEANEKVGVLFREGKTGFRDPHRNILKKNTIRDNGSADEGVGVDVRGETHDVVISDCAIEDSGQGRQKIGVRIGPRARGTQLVGNRFKGLEKDVEELAGD